MQEQLRRLPQVQSLLEHAKAIALVQTYGRERVTQAIRLKLGDMRHAIKREVTSTAPFDTDAFLNALSDTLNTAFVPTLKPVINATGVLISTNLGRTKLAPEAAAAIATIAENYSTLEIDLDTGKRGSRQDHTEALICELTGAEAALVVNNCAASVLVTLSALAAGKEVITSRGELVEIGGAFRMPDVITQSGAHLREVGATNKTRASDYADAIGDKTALLLKSHTSNFKMIGFTSAPTRKDLAAIAAETSIPFVEDLGSGLLVSLADCHLPHEPIVGDVLREGVDLVMFSGDKLLGGPQAGIIAGKSDLIARIRKHPVARACRIDKLSLAALHATLSLYIAPNDPFARIPILVALAEPIDQIAARAEALLEHLTPTAYDAKIIETKALAGGGTLPEQDLPSYAIALSSQILTAQALAKKLRQYETPIIARISDDQVILDVRAMTTEDLPIVAAAIRRAFTNDH
jgi:L-seryl-tRNA(Ser) seleniumtransferase